MWVIDMRDWLNESRDGPAAPWLKKRVEKLKEIIALEKYQNDRRNDG